MNDLANPTLKPISPQFLVEDLGLSIAYYRDSLGFEINIQHADYYASVKRDDAEIHLKAAPKVSGACEFKLENQHLDAYIWVTEFDALYTEFQSSGALILYPPTTQEWGVRDFYVKDTDGYILCFAQS